jgi:IS30 family transposase
MLEQGFSKSKIGELLGKDKSVIGREIERNKDQRSGKYNYILAENKSQLRHKQKHKHRSFTDDIRLYVDRLLKDDLSPEQIVGISKKSGIDSVSHERIYQYVWEDKKQKGELYLHLRRKGRTYRKRGASKDSRGIIKNRISIDQRPEVVEKRIRFGDLEVDLIIGKNHNQAILTINDRASGMLKMKKVASKESSVVTVAINNLLEEWMPYLHTITADNGKEFAGHQQVAETLDIDYYFAHPYHSWERGSNENLNGLIRQYFPKGSDFTEITQQRIAQIETKINKRPRKRFGYETPIFVMNKLLFNSEVAFMS